MTYTSEQLNGWWHEARDEPLARERVDAIIADGLGKATCITQMQAENARLTAVLTKISDQTTTWEAGTQAYDSHASDKVKIERLRWQFLGQLARKALKEEQP